MHKPADKSLSIADDQRRLAALAVSCFAANPVQVEAVLRAVHERQGRGEDADLLAALTAAKLITSAQADSLRRAATMPKADDEASTRKATKIDRTAPAVEVPPQVGPFRILRRLGRGGMGSVFLAFDTRENRQVALKILVADQAPKSNVLQRFQRESRHGALLIHPNIVRTFGADQDPETGLHFIVLEYVEGITALDLLERFGKLPIGDAVHLILDIAQGLEHAHQHQIIHRDIKPGNILVTPSGLAKLSDLGLAKRRDDPTSLTHASQGIGTPYYVPYEQAMNARQADERSDIFALGATLYHLLTGEVPFPGESSLEIVERKGRGKFRRASEWNPDVPITLDEILNRMLARDPDDRHQTASEVIVDLERSQLAAAIPSFVQLDSALEDPVVVERLTSPVETTQPDMKLTPASESEEQQVWYLRYRDARGKVVKAKGSAASVIERIAAGSIPANAEASRLAQGRFRPLAHWPAFREALDQASRPPEPPPEPETRSRRRRWWIAAAAGVCLAAGLIGLAFWLL